MNRKLKYAVVAVLAILTVASILYMDGRYRNAQTAATASQLQLLGTLRRSALETYFSTASAEVSFWSLSNRIHESMRDLNAGWKALADDPGTKVLRLYNIENVAPGSRLASLDDAGDGSAYSNAHGNLHNFAREFVTGRGYYDFFLIDLDGNVIYTVEKERDFGSNLQTGPYRDSGLADVFRQVTNDDSDQVAVAISDLEPYAPSNNAPAIFAGQLMRDDAGMPLGVLALQLPTNAIGEIMRFTAGMGESGETYLVGDDFLMRSDSRFAKKSTILSTTVDTETVRLALQGQTGVDFTPDYRGIMVLSAYDFIDINGRRWAIMAEIDAAEVYASIGNIRSTLTAAGAALFALLVLTLGALGDSLLPRGGAMGSGVDVDLDGS